MCRRLIAEQYVLDKLKSLSNSNPFFSQYVLHLRSSINCFWIFAWHSNFSNVAHALSDAIVPENLAQLRGSKNGVVHLYNKIILSETATKTDVMIRMMSTGPNLVFIKTQLDNLEMEFTNSVQKLRYHGLYDHKKYYKDKNEKPFLTGHDQEYYTLCNQLYRQMKVIGSQFLHVSLQAQVIWKRYGKT